MATKRKSRLRRVEDSRHLRQAYLLIGLTILIIGGLIVFGLPLMVKLVGFWGDLRSGNEISTSKDKIAPPVPILESYPQYTNEASIELNGRTEAGVVVSTRVNSYPLDEVITDSDGKFTLFVDLDEGLNAIKIVAEDPAGNKSQSKEIEVDYDQEAPELTLTNPTETVYTTEESRVTISGSTEPLIYVYLNDRRLVVNTSGAFSTQVTLSEGENTYILKAKDKAGNETEVELKITYSRF